MLHEISHSIRALLHDSRLVAAICAVLRCKMHAATSVDRRTVTTVFTFACAPSLPIGVNDLAAARRTEKNPSKLINPTGNLLLSGENGFSTQPRPGAA
jgi:hypothetical protein